MINNFYHAETGVYLSLGKAFSLEGVSYPANWLDLATTDEISGLGITEVVTVGARGDESLFDNAEVLWKGVLTITSTPKPHAQIVKVYEDALDAHLDSVAQLHRYKDRFSFALRAGYVGPYQSEGIAFAQWMDACNKQSFELLEAVSSGQAEIPGTPADFISLLPAFQMP